MTMNDEKCVFGGYDTLASVYYKIGLSEYFQIFP